MTILKKDIKYLYVKLKYITNCGIPSSELLNGLYGKMKMFRFERSYCQLLLILSIIIIIIIIISY
jgi:hypothetical protein